MGVLIRCSVAWSSDCPFIDEDKVRQQQSASTLACQAQSTENNGKSVTQQITSIVLKGLTQVFKLLTSDQCGHITQMRPGRPILSIHRGCCRGRPSVEMEGTIIGLTQTAQAAKSIIPRETQPPFYKYSGHLLLS